MEKTDPGFDAGRVNTSELVREARVPAAWDEGWVMIWGETASRRTPLTELNGLGAPVGWELPGWELP